MTWSIVSLPRRLLLLTKTPSTQANSQYIDVFLSESQVNITGNYRLQCLAATETKKFVDREISIEYVVGTCTPIREYIRYPFARPQVCFNGGVPKNTS